MQNGFFNLVARSENDESSFNPTMIGLLVTLLVLAIVALFSVATLYYLRLRRRSREQQLPLYDEKRSSSSSHLNGHRRVAVRPSQSIIVYQEKQHLIDNSDSPPTSPVPEIRITFPEEVDNAGKLQSGRVVVVRVGEHSIGLEPVADENLPPYQKDQSDRFQSLDLERIGGLTEKEVEARFS